jgi:hypothetical protein
VPLSPQRLVLDFAVKVAHLTVKPLHLLDLFGLGPQVLICHLHVGVMGGLSDLGGLQISRVLVGWWVPVLIFIEKNGWKYF